MKQNKSPFRGMALASFCMQLSLLCQAGGGDLAEGISFMAEDADGAEEKRILTEMAEKLDESMSVSQVVAEADCFPTYMVEMTAMGEENGKLDVILRELSEYYERETRLAESLRRALTYPAMMVFMLLVILFVLFVKIMPIFSGVYEQLGASIPPVAQAAINIGGVLSGVALAVIVILAVGIVVIRVLGDKGKQPAFAAAILNFINSHSAITRLTAVCRFCNAVSVALSSGGGEALEYGMDMAQKLVDHPLVSQQIKKTRELVLDGNSFYSSVKESGLFTGFDLQMIRAARDAGRTSTVLRKLSDDYDQRAQDALDSMVSRLEPAIVTILAVAVGLVLLSVMLPLAGILSAIG